MLYPYRPIEKDQNFLREGNEVILMGSGNTIAIKPCVEEVAFHLGSSRTYLDIYFPGVKKLRPPEY